MIILKVNDKKFGKNFIDYTVVNKDSNEILENGKCGNFNIISSLFFKLRERYGNDNVKMLTR